MLERRAVPVRDLTEREVALIASSTATEGTPYDLADVPEMPRFTLADYRMRRDPGESDEDYAARLGLFR